MNAADFERDLLAWRHGALTPDRAAAMQRAADENPEFARRAEEERAFDVRVRRALVGDGDAAAVRAMLARARTAQKPAGRLLGFPRAAWRVAAALFVVAWIGTWWFCIPPFECSYMQALEHASHDSAATPGPGADDMAKRFRLPAQVGDALAAPPAAMADVDFHAWNAQFDWHLDGVRLDYVRPDGPAFHVVACASPGVRPSIRRRVRREGKRWWIGDFGGARTVVFEGEGNDVLYAVSGPAGDDEVYAAACLLRDAVR